MFCPCSGNQVHNRASCCILSTYILTWTVWTQGHVFLGAGLGLITAQGSWILCHSDAMDWKFLILIVKKLRFVLGFVMWMFRDSKSQHWHLSQPTFPLTSNGSFGYWGDLSLQLSLSSALPPQVPIIFLHQLFGPKHFRMWEHRGTHSHMRLRRPSPIAVLFVRATKASLGFSVLLPQTIRLAESRMLCL